MKLLDIIAVGGIFFWAGWEFGAYFVVKKIIKLMEMSKFGERE